MNRESPREAPRTREAPRYPYGNVDYPDMRPRPFGFVKHPRRRRIRISIWPLMMVALGYILARLLNIIVMTAPITGDLLVIFGHF